jgi:hypothetical protein
MLFEMLRRQNMARTTECRLDDEARMRLEAMEAKVCMAQALRSWERPEPAAPEIGPVQASAAKPRRHHKFLRAVRA